MNIFKDIAELMEAGVITNETAERIKHYYESKHQPSTNRLFIVFGVLGAILVGLGIILVIAHNWDELSRTTKTFFAFLPLLSGQIFCGFTLLKKPESIAWRESTSAFLFFAVGASISLVSQVYNLPGDISSFLLTWMLLCLPLVYVMRSSMVAILYLIGITAYAQTNNWSYPPSESYLYWLLLLLLLPHYYFLCKKKPGSNFIPFLNWLIPLSILIALGTLVKTTENIVIVTYFSLFGLFYLIGETAFFRRQKLRNNGYKVLGITGTVILLLALSFDWFWEDLRAQEFPFNEIAKTLGFWVMVIISLSALVLLFLQQKNKKLTEIKPLSIMFILFIIIFIIGLRSSIPVILINLCVLILGILTIRDGAKQDHLGILNFGILIITALVTCRFFDENLSFVIRGILFLLVGIGFFAVNYWMLKKRKTNE